MTKLTCIATAALLGSNLLAAQVQFAITGTANSSGHGYNQGQSYTFTFTVNRNYTGGSEDLFSANENTWGQRTESDPNIFTDISGDSLTGVYTPIFEPGGQSHYQLNVVPEDGKQELWLTADASAFGYDIGLQTPDGTGIGDFAVEIILEDFTVPYPGLFVNPTDFWSTNAGTYALTDSNSWFDFDAYISGVDTNGDPNEAQLIAFTPTSLTILVDDDDDGLSNTKELSIGTNPNNPDTDGDGFYDGFEVNNGYSPTNTDAVLINYIHEYGERFDLYSSNVVLNIAIGEILITCSNQTAFMNIQLEQTENLQAWTNAGESVEWSLPISENKKYFRVQAEK